MSKNAEKFVCMKCDFKCSKKSEWNRHVSTHKHKILTNPTLKNAEKTFSCSCGKKYKHSSSLSHHRKTHNCDDETFLVKKSNNCIIEHKYNNSGIENIISTLHKENNDFKKLLVEQNNKLLELCKTNNNTTIINNNSNNKTFNLNLFLNEECKDAMNIKDFVNSVQLQLTDLEHVGKVGFINGISNIIIKNLQALDVNKRPVHCSDLKRETMYVKDENKWEKENEQKQRLRNVVKEIASKNTRILPQFKKKYPDTNQLHSKKADEYNELMIKSLGGLGDNDEDNESKIIRKIAKEVRIDK